MDYTNLITQWSPFENSVEPTNPLGIQYGPYAISQGAIGANGSQAVFPSLDHGVAAANNLLNSSGYSNLSLGDMLARWVNGTSATHATNPASYADSMATQNGFDLSQPLTSFAGNKTDEQKAIDQITSGTNNDPSAGTFGTGQHNMDSASNWFTANLGRWSALALGLLCIGTGLFLFKPVQDTVVSISKSAVKAAA